MPIKPYSDLASITPGLALHLLYSLLNRDLPLPDIGLHAAIVPGVGGVGGLDRLEQQARAR
jgi:hypothetical protein